ncbi:MAG: hypothetical protein WD009_10750 [Phycisphaeraceae bacterium]
MSVQGTGPAAGIVQTAHQAQQLARQQAKRAQERQRAAERLRDSFKTRLRGLEKDDAEHETRLYIDGELIDAAQRRPRDDNLARRQRRDALQAPWPRDTARVALAHVALPADLAPPTPAAPPSTAYADTEPTSTLDIEA